MLRPLALLLPLTALLCAPLAAAGADDAALKKVRAALPAVEDAGGWRYWGEVWQGTRWLGTLRLEVKAGLHEEAPAWVASERVDLPADKTPLTAHASFTLGRDLALLEGAWGGEAGGTGVDGSLTRKGATYVWQATRAQGEQAASALALGAPPAAGALAGLAPVVMLARALRAEPAAAKGLTLPWLDSLSLLPGEAKALHGPASVEVVGAGKHGGLAGEPAVWSVKLVSAGKDRALTVHLDAEGQRVVGFETPTWSVLPTGSRPAAARFDPEAPARTWQDAFLKFGVGYHMAKQALLESAFHWETMYEYETSLVDGWPASSPLAEFKQAWVKEFMAQSLHRNEAETFGLLNGTMGTGKVHVKTPDLIVLEAIAQFGGGIQRTYHLRRFDGVWYLTRIDSAE